MQVQSVPWVLGEKVTDLLVVDLEITCSDEELSLLRVALYSLEDVLEGTRHDSFLNWVVFLTCHRMGLTGSCLAIGEDGSVVTFKHIFDNATRAFGVDQLLGKSPVETHIESKLLWWLI